MPVPIAGKSTTGYKPSTWPWGQSVPLPRPQRLELRGKRSEAKVCRLVPRRRVLPAPCKYLASLTPGSTSDCCCHGRWITFRDWQALHRKLKNFWEQYRLLLAGNQDFIRKRPWFLEWHRSRSGPHLGHPGPQFSNHWNGDNKSMDFTGYFMEQRRKCRQRAWGSRAHRRRPTPNSY